MSAGLDYQRKPNRDASIHAASDPVLLTIHFDGLCEPKNPAGIPVYAFIVSDTTTGRVVAQEAGLAGEPWVKSATHDLAEYTAAINSVKWVREHAPTAKLSIYGDSKPVIQPLNKAFKVKSREMLPLFNELTSQLEGLSWKAVWVRGENNSQADKLTNDFYRDYCIKHYGRIMPTMRETGAIY